MSLSKPYLLTLAAKEPFTVECWKVEQTGLAYYQLAFPEELVDLQHSLIAEYPHTDRYLVIHATSGLQISPIGHWFYTETQAQAFSKMITEFFDWTCDQSHFKTMTHVQKLKIQSICENCYWQILAHYHRYRRETIEKHLFLVAEDLNAMEGSPVYQRQFHPAYADEIYTYSKAFAWKKKEIDVEMK